MALLDANALKKSSVCGGSPDAMLVIGQSHQGIYVEKQS
jgi:hypothetical protein